MGQMFRPYAGEDEDAAGLIDMDEDNGATERDDEEPGMILKRIWDMGVVEVVVAWLSDLDTRRSAVTVDGPVLFRED